jgi:hypothetical protein
MRLKSAQTRTSKAVYVATSMTHGWNNCEVTLPLVTAYITQVPLEGQLFRTQPLHKRRVELTSHVTNPDPNSFNEHDCGMLLQTRGN